MNEAYFILYKKFICKNVKNIENLPYSISLINLTFVALRLYEDLSSSLQPFHSFPI